MNILTRISLCDDMGRVEVGIEKGAPSSIPRRLLTVSSNVWLGKHIVPTKREENYFASGFL